MKTVYKTLITLLSILMPLTLSAQNFVLASNQSTNTHFTSIDKSEKLNRALDAFERGLSHSIPAIVESSMFNLLVLKIDYPELDYSNSLKKLEYLTIHGKTSVIRHKAYITSSYMKDSSLFLDVDSVEFNQYMDVEKADYFYLALSKVLTNQIALN